MARQMLTDERWSKLKAIMHEQGIYHKRQLRRTVEGILYRLRVGCPWRDLPGSFGRWNSVYQAFNRWSADNKLMNIFKSLVTEPDLEWEFMDGSFVKAHQHSRGAASKQDEAIGQSCGGNNTKIHMVVESFGLPIEFVITGGQVHDSQVASQLIELTPTSNYMIADRGYHAEPIRDQIRERGSIPVIPRRKNSLVGNGDIDWGLYRCRHLVENVFARLKHFRAIATRYDKLKRNFKSMLALACAYLWLPM